MASRIQAKSSAGGAAPDVPVGLPATALAEPAPVGSGAAARACGEPGAGAPFFTAGSVGLAGTVPSGGFGKAREAERAAGSGRTAVPGALDGVTAATTGGGAGRCAIPAGGRRVRSITCGGLFGVTESAKIIAAPAKRCRRRDAPAPFQTARSLQPRGTGTLSCCPITTPSCVDSYRILSYFSVRRRSRSAAARRASPALAPNAAGAP